MGLSQLMGLGIDIGGCPVILYNLPVCSHTVPGLNIVNFFIQVVLSTLSPDAI